MTGGALRRAGARGAFVALALCAGGSSATRVADGLADPQPPCEYRRVFVERGPPLGAWDPRAEPLRREILGAAEELLPDLGWEPAAEPADAYWRISANAWLDRQGNPLVHLAMRGELKLGRHLFVVSMADESFPFRGAMGGSYNFANASRVAPAQLRAQVEAGLHWISTLDAEQLAALCEARAALVDEGWAEVEALRQQLVYEMEQIRRARARQRARKALELEVQGDDLSGRPE